MLRRSSGRITGLRRLHSLVERILVSGVSSMRHGELAAAGPVR
jgi:hypothetical protein